MPNYAIIQEKTIVNVIVADSQEIAEEVTGLTAIETDGAPWLGWTYHNDSWIPPMPETGGPWIWNEEIQSWETPSE